MQGVYVGWRWQLCRLLKQKTKRNFWGVYKSLITAVNVERFISPSHPPPSFSKSEGYIPYDIHRDHKSGCHGSLRIIHKLSSLHIASRATYCCVLFFSLFTRVSFFPRQAGYNEVDVEPEGAFRAPRVIEFRGVVVYALLLISCRVA